MMKKYFFLMVMSAMFLYSCSDDVQDIITNPTTLLPSMTATVDGANWSTDKPGAVFLADSNRLTLTGLNEADSSLITISIKAPAVQSYDLGDSTSGSIAVYDLVNVGQSGNFSITSYSAGKLMSGSFSFETDSFSTIIEKHSISAGEFKNVVIVTQ